MEERVEGKSRAASLVDVLERRSGVVIAAVLLVTGLLVIPLLVMEPPEQASIDPPAEVFELQREIDALTQSPTHGIPFIVEAGSGDVLTQAVLWQLYQSTAALREADEGGGLAPDGLPVQPYLYSGFDLTTNRPVVGVTSIADAVALLLLFDPSLNTTLEAATDDQVKIAVHRLLSNRQTGGLLDLLSSKAVSERRTVNGSEIDYWTSPALVLLVMADNEKLGGGSLHIGIGGGDVVRQKEELGRNVQSVLRGDQDTYRLWGIAIDVNLESEEEGRSAGIFIMFTVIAAVAIVGISLRSYWAMALTGVGLGILMVWLKGITALVGVKGGLVIDLIVPIAMISLGVDFAVHALRRYQEERDRGLAPSLALRVGLAGVLGALALAMATDGVAFLANVSSRIEAVVHFGVAAAIAVGSSFVILGVVVPLAMSRVDHLRSLGSGSRLGTADRLAILAGGAGVAALSGTGVILLVAVSEPLGLGVLAATLVGFVVAPAAMLRWRSAGTTGETGPRPEELRRSRSSLVESIAAGPARYAPAVLLVAVVVTGAAAFFATRLEPTFDVKDFFDADSDFVVGLDKLDEHIGQRGGEPGLLYIKGDLTDPEALVTVGRLVEGLAGNPYVARDAEGSVSTGTTVLSLLERLLGSSYALTDAADWTGVVIVDSDSDGIPDSTDQIKAAFDYMVQEGVPLDERTLVFDPGHVKEVLFHDPDGHEENVTVISVGIPGTREQTTVAAARESLERDLALLDGTDSITRSGLTGSPFTREAQLDATTRSLRTSLPIAAAGALALLLVAMRSVRYALVTVIPIGLVVAWLYGIMHLMGFSLNLVTATIGAVSIGVGIDYSIHMTERFREELAGASSKSVALRRAARGTGVALVASAASSIVGFAIMGFAPMPLFASYGLLTALMIFLALAASLLVLPSLLMIATPERAEETDG